MKKLLLTITLLLNFVLFFAQSPAAFNYQAVLRDASGNIRVNANINLRVDIIKTSATGTMVYAETFASTTNAFGLINLQVGKGTIVSGTFNTIDWSAGPYFIKITVDGTEISTSQMMSVPYALYAAKAGNGFSGDYNDLTGKPTLATVANSGSYNDLLNKPTETDPVYGASVAKSIKASDTTRWSAKSNFSGKFGDLIGSPVYINQSKAVVSLGFSNLGKNTTGSNLSAFGNNSLYDNTTGYNNTASGANSLRSNTEGRCNTAMGTYALNFNTIGSFNTAFGTGAIGDNTTGSNNTAVGSDALSLNITESNNTAVGSNALMNSKNRDNTALGYQALQNNSSGYENVAIGSKSMLNNLGNANTAVGFNSMPSNINGTLNTAIGCYTDIANNVSNSTAIGNGASVNANDKIVLGNSSVTNIGGYATFTNFSDARLKENIEYSNKLGLEFISCLRTATYNYKADPNKRQRNGLIAQDVEKTMKDLRVDFSGLVVDNNQQKTLNLSYSEFVIPLINSVQELNMKNLELQQKNENLEATISSMKADIEALKKAIQK